MCGSEYFPKSIKEKYGYDVDLNSKYYKDHEAFQVFQMLKQSNNFYSITHEDFEIWMKLEYFFSCDTFDCLSD